MTKLATCLLTIAAAAAPAAASSYSATLEVPSAGRVIARDISWTCTLSTCEGSTKESRPIVLCESLAKRAGKIQAFLVDGRALAPTDLDRCNASARTDQAKTLAGK